MRIAYLCNRYPSVSLTFIQREVAALRELGVRIETMAIRRAFGDHILSDADREALGSTFTVLPPRPASILLAHLTALILRPRRYALTLILALRLRPRGLRGAIWQLFYFVEAIVVWRECRRRGIRHIHVHFANVAADVALLATHFGGERAGCSWSFTLHGPVEFFDVTQSRLAEKLARASFVVCISDFARSQAMTLLEHSCWEKLHVVHCGVDLDAFPAVVRSRGEPPLNILNVGRLVREKGHASLLEALALARRSGVEASLTVVGDGPERETLESLAVQLSIADHVSFVGFVGQDEIAAYYCACDVFCLASFAEGVPVVLMEAMAMEIPVITTRIAGIPELVEHGHSGLVVAPGDPDAIAAAIAELSEPGRRAALGCAGRRTVAADFELFSCARTLRAIFADALTRQARSGSIRADGHSSTASHPSAR
jgi:colanic acid/amylovoran biosynthesis glycosyltransferase